MTDILPWIRVVVAGVLLTSLATAGCSDEPVLTPRERLEAAGEPAARLLVAAHRATEAGQYAAALARIDSLTRLAPELPQAYYQRGLVLMRLYQLDAAEKAFRRTAELDPYHRGAFYKRGHVDFERAQFRDAIRWYQRQQDVVETSPEELRAYYERQDQTVLAQSWLQIGRAYQLLQRSDSARWAYEHVLEIDSTHAQASAWLAAVLGEEGNSTEALVHARRAWRHEQRNPEYAYELGTLLLKNDQMDDALPLLEYVAEVQPWNAGAHYNLGRALIAKGQTEEGERHLARTDRLQDLDQAVDQAYAAAARFPDDPARWRALARLLDRAGRTGEREHALAVARGHARLATADTTSRSK